MLHLDAGIHFQEVETVVRGKEKLAGPCPTVAHRLSSGYSCGAHPFAEIDRERGGRRFFNQLLMAPLNGAFALAQVQRALLIGQYLNFDVAGTLDKFFQVDGGIAERLERLGCGGVECSVKPRRIRYHPHAFATTARDGLHDHRVPDFIRERPGLRAIADRGITTRYHRYAGLAHAPACLDLVAHSTDCGCGWPDPDQFGVFDGLGERGALREKAVPWMNGIGAALTSSRDESFDREVALRGLRRSNCDSEVGRTHVGTAPICRGVYCHRLDSFFVTGSDNAQRDLTAVRDENPLYRSKRTRRLT
jgi:hypothetical protein